MKRSKRFSADEAVAKMMRFVYDDDDCDDEDLGDILDSDDDNDLQDLNGGIEGL